MWGGTRRSLCRGTQWPFQSTRPLWGGTTTRRETSWYPAISIHPPLVGRDFALPPVHYYFFISIHPPLVGRDENGCQICSECGISIHPPLVGRDEDWRELCILIEISIHPPLVGRDAGDKRRPHPGQISIHPPLVGRDAVLGRDRTDRRISIHPPLVGRDGKAVQVEASGAFQSTRPLWGGTAILHKKTVQNIAYCTKSAFTLAVLSGFLALMRPFFCQTCTNFGANLPKNRCSLPVRTLIPSGPPPADSRH